MSRHQQHVVWAPRAKTVAHRKIPMILFALFGKATTHAYNAELCELLE